MEMETDQSPRALNPDNYEDMLIIDDFNKKLYQTYKSSSGKLKKDKLDEFVIDPETGRVYIKDLVVYDNDGNKISYSNYTYSISTRKINNGEYKNYIVRHKNRYLYRNKPTNKFEYLIKISTGSIDESDNSKFIIPDLKITNNITKPIYDYLNDETKDVATKNKIKLLINDILEKYRNKMYNDKKNIDLNIYDKSAELSNILSRISNIPKEFKFNYKQLVNWLYRYLH